MLIPCLPQLGASPETAAAGAIGAVAAASAALAGNHVDRARGNAVKVRRTETVNNGMTINYILDTTDNRTSNTTTDPPNPPPP